MKVVKILCNILSLIMLLTGICGCSDNKTLTVEEIAQSLEELCLPNEGIYEISKSDIENRFTFDGNLIGDCQIKMCETEEKYLIVAVLQLKDTGSRQTVIDGINSTVKAASASFGVLGGNELAKIQQRLFYEYNDILILVISDNYESAKGYLEDIGAKAVVQ